VIQSAGIVDKMVKSEAKKKAHRRPPHALILTLPDRLNQIMDAKGWDTGRGRKARLAAKVGMSPGQISAIMNADRLGGIDAGTVINLADKLEVNPGWLLTGRGDMFGAEAPTIDLDAIRSAAEDGARAALAARDAESK